MRIFVMHIAWFAFVISKTINKTLFRKFVMTPWNKGISQGQKKPLSFAQVQKIKIFLKKHNQLRDLALFSTAIDTMLRSSDLLKLKVLDVMEEGGNLRDEINIKQKKTKKPHMVNISDKSKTILSNWIKESRKKQNDYLFTGLYNNQKPITRERYADLVKKWLLSIKIDPTQYSTHSLRRTKSVAVFEKTKNVEIVRQLLGQKSTASTVHYLGISHRNALDVARGIKF